MSTKTARNLSCQGRLTGEDLVGHFVFVLLSFIFLLLLLLIGGGRENGVVAPASGPSFLTHRSCAQLYPHPLPGHTSALQVPFKPLWNMLRWLQRLVLPSHLTSGFLFCLSQSRYATNASAQGQHLKIHHFSFELACWK